MLRRKVFQLLLMLTAIVVLHPIAKAQSPGPQQINKPPSSAVDHRIKYGKDPLQLGDLRLPEASGRHPVAVVIHGGCWKSGALQSTVALSSALTNAGVATWNIDYRGIDSPGGGWTGTFEDVANAVDYLSVLANSYPLDLKRVIVIGHSAGGHLATWVAARHRLPQQSPLFSKKPLPVQGVLNLAGPADLENFLPLQNMACGDAVITKLIGGAPSEMRQRYEEASPVNLLPIGVKQVLIIGAKDKAVPPETGKKYEEDAKKKGDDVRLIVIENASHFDVIAPGSAAWPKVEESALSMLKATKTASK